MTKVSNVTSWSPGCRGGQPPDSSPWRGGTHDRGHAHVQHRAGDVANFDFFKDVCLLVNSPSLIHTKIFCLFQGAVRAHEAR